MERKPRVCIVGVPMDLGQSRRGVDMGPSAVRYADLDDRLRDLGFHVNDCGNVKIPVRDELFAEEHNSYSRAVVAAAERVCEAGTAALAADELPVYLGGDHSMALGTVSAAAARSSLGVVWIDAHGDFNTPQTSPSGNLHGMPLAALTGHGSRELVDAVRAGAKVSESDVVLLGVRSLDPGEREALRASQVSVFTMREVDERGIARVAHEALERLQHCRALHISLDMDCLDPSQAPGVGTPVPGGLTYREAHLLMEIIAASGTVASIEVVEINPILDQGNRTAQIAVGLIASALGQTIL